jgi:hypothetical protein
LTKITDLMARVVRPDGTSVPFAGRVFEKTVLRTGQIKVTVKTFALPDVEVGSIVDYRYKIVPDNAKSSTKGLEALEDLFGNSGDSRSTPRPGPRPSARMLTFKPPGLGLRSH